MAENCFVLTTKYLLIPAKQKLTPVVSFRNNLDFSGSTNLKYVSF